MNAQVEGLGSKNKKVAQPPEQHPEKHSKNAKQQLNEEKDQAAAIWVTIGDFPKKITSESQPAHESGYHCTQRVNVHAKQQGKLPDPKNLVNKTCESRKKNYQQVNRFMLA